MVVSAKNGSMVAVTGSGIRHMSDSLIAFQPAMEEPSNIVPSAKISSSIMEMSKVTCCHLPRGSVKRRSTYLTSLSLIDLRTSLAVFMYPPLDGDGGIDRAAGRGRPLVNTIGGCPTQYQSIGRFRSDGIEPGFAGPDANGLFDVGHEDLAVADPPGLSRTADGVDRPLDQFVGNHYFDLHLGQKVDNVLGAAVELGVALLPPEPLGFGDGNALQSDFLKRFFDLVELEWLDDGFDFFHRSPPGHFRISDFRFVSTLREVAQVFDRSARRLGAHIHHLPVQHNDPEPTSSKA